MPWQGESSLVKRSSIFTGASVATAILSLSGCATPQFKHLPTGEAAYKQIPVEAEAADRKAFLIAPGDELTLRVVGEADLSLDKVIVDNAGTIQIPLAGEVAVAGHTPGEASLTIKQLLHTKGVRFPEVALNISSPVQRTVSVEGQVTKAGVYPITPDTTLLSTIALAESPTRIASLGDIIVLRVKNGDRYAARFNLQRLRGGLDPDPQILPGDTVIVGFSQTKSIYRDALQAVYLLSTIFQKL